MTNLMGEFHGGWWVAGPEGGRFRFSPEALHSLVT